jgi:hydroxyacyl-ACP dehydratase HTD2-like protein with hotdog domain
MHTRDFSQTEVSLFRFSALTFNAHKIHYSRDWCRNIEGHRDCVVHGPLNLINILDLYRDVKDSAPDKVPRSITYRAQSPLYVGEKYRILLHQEEKEGGERQRWTADVVDSYGKTGMKGTIVE